MATKLKTTMPSQKKRNKARQAVAGAAAPTTKPGSQKRREQITAAGGRQLNVLLKSTPNRALVRLMKHYRLPAVQVVTRLLIDAAAQLNKSGKSAKSAAASAAPTSTQPRRVAGGRAKKVTAASKVRRKNAGTV